MTNLLSSRRPFRSEMQPTVNFDEPAVVEQALPSAKRRRVVLKYSAPPAIDGKAVHHIQPKVANKVWRRTSTNVVMHELDAPPSEGASILPQPVAVDTHADPCLFPSWYTLELFGGCAKLTRCLQQQDFESTAVDYTRNRSTPVAATILLDLTTVQGQTIIRRALRSGKVKFLHMAPPCGTASRAREIPLAPHVRAKGVREPKPLRSAKYPSGLPTLEGSDLERVLAANTLFICSGMHPNTR
jgi:hypothetical protein